MAEPNQNIPDPIKQDPKKEAPLPSAHKPTVPLPKSAAAPAEKKPPEPLPKSPAIPVEKKPVVEKVVSPPMPTSGKKPKDVKLPEKGQPELDVPEVKKPPEKEIPKNKVRSLEGTKPTFETGPVIKRDPRKILMIVGSVVGIIIGILVLVYVLRAGVGFVKRVISSNGSVEETEVTETPETPVVETPKVDKTSLDSLRGFFGETGKLVETLKKGVDFEPSLNLGRERF